MRIRRPRLIGLFLALLLAVPPLAAAAEGTRLLRHPDVSERNIVFAYGGDLWIVARGGGDARRLTSFQGVEDQPRFSPDGRWVAFSGEYDGNTDIYIVPVEGGEPRRLTWHPGADEARGFSNDGTQVYFASSRTGAPFPYPKFWSVSVDGGNPEPLIMPRVWRGAFSPDARHFAYEPVSSWETEFRNYRGGQNKPIWILDLNDHSLVKVPWTDSNDMNPVYAGDTIYFLSDVDWAMNVHAYDPRTRQRRQVTRFKDFDVKNLESGGGLLVFEQGGFIHLLDPATGQSSPVDIQVRGDFPWARPHWEDVAGQMGRAALSPNGKRAVFEARGEIFSVPAKKGDVRNLSRNSGVADRAPAWSPDGKHVSWFSDESGEYQLVIADQMGQDRKGIKLDSPTFYYTPAWSPDSKHISFGDADRKLWVVDVASGEARRIDDEGYAHPVRTIYPEWSPDSRWIAYTKRLDNQYNAVWVYSLATGQTHAITDGLSDSTSPAWDKGGKYLYFLGSTDYGLNVGWLDMSSYQRPITRAIYLAVLAADEPSPLLPESDDEGGDDEKKKDKKDGAKDRDNDKKKGKKDKDKDDEDGDKPDEVPEVKIDFPGLDQRILALNGETGNYLGLLAGEKGTLFYFEGGDDGPAGTLHRYKLDDRESKEFIDGIESVTISQDGKKLLYGASGNLWGILDATGGPQKVGEGKLDLSGARMHVDPAAEWMQIFREAWRYQRDYFYVENVHGLDLDRTWEMYSPWIAHVRHRSDLTYLLDILGGETAVGHSFTGGGDNPDVDRIPVGLLGADYDVADGRYRFAKIYNGENWNPSLRAPLRGPGIDIKQGEYLLAVDGVELEAGTNPYSLFDRKADRQTVLTVNAKPSLDGARKVTVVPVGNEVGLRQRDWIEGNRRRVDELSGGKLAYVWLPNTGFGGYTNFNRYYFAQMDKQGAVIDERFNTGGSAADYMIDLMARPLTGYFNNPLGEKKPFTNPNAGIWGPKVMIINDAAGSGGDLLPYMFRARNIGPLIGTRTWGGLVGIWDVPALIDGGNITAPRGGFYDNDGKWAVENEGVAPDIEVEQLPAEVIKGRDPQLEKAVEVALDLLKRNPLKLMPQPADPIRARRPE